tara:strand:+ start:464 stop:1189 length:726 start_codon:yes stop_codon:yes gene_type:complete
MTENSVLVILPGWGGSSETWRGFVDFLGSHIPDLDVKVFELPCFGETSCPTEVWGVREYAKFVKHKLAHLNYDRIILLGHSFGGQVATYLVAHHPEVCERLVLSGAAVYRPKRKFRRTVFWVVAQCVRVFLKIPLLKHRKKRIKKNLYRIIGSLDYQESAGVKREIYKKVIREDVSELLGRIMVHTDVVWGAKDKHTPLRYGKKIVAEIPNAQLHVIKDGTHGLHRHKKKAFLGILEKILA